MENATIAEVFGRGYNCHKVTLAFLEPDEDVTLDEMGETINEWDKILGYSTFGPEDMI